MTSTELTPVVQSIEKATSLADVLKGRVRPQAPEIPVVLPLPAVLTTEDRNALQALPEVFGKVVPTERVALTPVELTSLFKERQVLAQVAKIAEERKESIRTTVVNHFDVTLEKTGVPADTLRDKEGHYLATAKQDIPDSHKRFAWEIRQGAPKINEKALYEMCHTEGSGLTHEDWLKMTMPVVGREFSEEKAMMHLKEHPELLDKIVEAAVEPVPVGALYVR